MENFLTPLTIRLVFRICVLFIIRSVVPIPDGFWDQILVNIPFRVSAKRPHKTQVATGPSAPYPLLVVCDLSLIESWNSRDNKILTASTEIVKMLSFLDFWNWINIRVKISQESSIVEVCDRIWQEKYKMINNEFLMFSC